MESSSPSACGYAPDASEVKVGSIAADRDGGGVAMGYEAGMRVVFNTGKGPHCGDSYTTWQDGVIVEVGQYVSSMGSAIWVSFPATKKRWGRKVMKKQWIAESQVVAVISRPSREVAELERMLLR